MDKTRFGKSRTRFGRFVMLPLALLLALAAAPFLSGPASAQLGTAQGAGAIELQVYICPDFYEGTDFLTDCSPSDDPILLTLSDDATGETLDGETGVNGFATFSSLADGDYTVSLGVPGDFASFYYACFDGADIYLFDGSTNQIGLSVENSSQYSCRWYVIPEPQTGETPTPSPTAAPVADGSVTVQVYVCPDFYEGDDFLTDCTPEEGIYVGLNAGEYDPETQVPAETDEDGFVAFIELEDDIYTVALGVPGDFASFYYACFDQTSGSEIYLFDGDENLLQVELVDGGDALCRWYVIPEPQDGSTPTPTATPDGDDDADDDDVTELPSTGTGTTSAPGTGLAAMVVALAVALVSGFVAIRRVVRPIA